MGTNTKIECGPNECPIVAFSDLTPTEQRVQRKRIAAKMAGQGFTEQQIAKQLGVSQQTISNDLANLPIVGNSKPAKTASNPKGAGRPKGSGKRTGPQERRRVDTREAAHLVLDRGMTYDQAAEATDTSLQVVRASVAREEGRREGRVDPEIDRASLSPSAQQRFDAAVRQHKAKLDASFHQAVHEAVQAKVRRHIEEIYLPDLRAKIEQAQKLYRHRRGAMDKDTFNTIRRALHPDSRHSISDRKLGEAFDAFMALEKFLLSEKDSPTEFPDLPKTWAEWERAKQKATAGRRARRRAGHSSLRPG